MSAWIGRAQTLEREGARGAISPQRIVGYLFYGAWLLSAFYNEFFYRSTPDFRSVLYSNTLMSLIVLSLTILVFPRIERRADKWVLSRRCIAISGLVLAGATALLCFSNAETSSGRVLVGLSSLGTGIGSGLLFLGWGRLYADTGTRVALIEMSLSWVGAGLLCVMLSLAPVWLACSVVIAGVLASSALLRRCTFSRPARPHPARPHRLQRRTKRLFARGALGCFVIGVVSGFCDVLAGFRFLPVPEHYEIYLALGCAVVALVPLAVALRSRHEFVTYAYRFVMLLLIVGSLLMPFMAQTNTLSYAVMFGAYSSFTILLCVVSIDVSNYFDQPATRVFGLAFFALYIGEISGNGLAHVLTDALHIQPDLSVVALVLTTVVATAYLFLFTEKDLIETSLGEMTDGEDTLPDSARTAGWGIRLGGFARTACGRTSGAASTDATGGSATGVTGLDGENVGTGAASEDRRRANASTAETAGANARRANIGEAGAGIVYAGEATGCSAISGGIGAASQAGVCAAAADGSCAHAGTVWSTCPAGVGIALAGINAAPATTDPQAGIEEVATMLAERFGLTPREADVLPLIIRGRTIARIQEELHISQGTVGTHMRHIYQKAGVRNRQGLLDLIDELAAANDPSDGTPPRMYIDE